MSKTFGRTRRWRIGELARATGITVRSLRHYEQMNLLTVSERTDGGHRLYDSDSLQRLYQIRALRDLGFSLPEIRRAIEGASLIELLRANLEKMDRQVTQATVMRDLLRNITTQETADVTVDQIPAKLGAMSRQVKQRSSNRCNCANRAEREEKWRQVRADLRACMERGESTRSRATQAIARRARALLTEIGGVDTTVSLILQVLTRLSEHHNLAGWDEKLIRYLDGALDALDMGNHKEQSSRADE
ncbi:MerR family transcriptional regulator [Bradyrhizobium sp. ORS 285]|uniref:MerR family transcriptional regulator n=1 Tax=Bradyrhizobium sp. ORS 285 TaxID=115808 RepID=UPI001112B9CC|nr:MerR family transcriptional regulator [Bradyrhizobium sp. ORS 285]